MKRTRVALIASHVIQYQDPFFRLLAGDPALDLEVLFCSRDGAVVYRDEDMKTALRWDIELLAGYRHRFLRNFGSGNEHLRLINPGIVPRLLFGRYDAAILFLGWGTITSLLAVAACRARGLPFFIFGDSAHPPDELGGAGRLRAGVLRALFRMTSGFLVSGKLNAEYYLHYGADARRFFHVPWAVDNERFATASAMGPEERLRLRRTFGADDDDVVFAFSGKLIPRKDPLTILRAVTLMKHRHRAVVLFLGHGELLDDVKAFAAEHSLRVHLAGFVNQSALPRYYGAADAFLLASLYEPRGTVVNEAMACGLPVVVTDCYGAVGDIVQEGENAMLFRPGDAAGLAAKLDTLVSDPDLRLRMAARSREIIATWDYRSGVDGVKAALASLERS